METLVRFSDGIERAIVLIGRIAAWFGVALILITVFDVVSRKFFVLGSTRLQELEWHFHTVLFMLCLGFCYLRDGHVRIDLVREQLPVRVRWWIEVVGCLLFLLPYCALILWFSVDFVWNSYIGHETSNSATGLGARWIIKMTLPAGFVLLALAGLVQLARTLVKLFGPAELRDRVAGAR